MNTASQPDHRWTYITWLSVLVALFHIYVNTIGNLPTQMQNGVHFASFILLCTLTVPFAQTFTSKHQLTGSLIRIADLLFGLLAASAIIFLVLSEDAIYQRGVRLSIWETIAAIIAILAAIEYTRRTTGWIIPTLIILSITYIGWWGKYMSGVFKFDGLSWETILFRSIYGDDALLGNIALISSSTVYMFILFGAFLIKSGAGDFIINVARALAGRFVGGPGFVAIFASALTGTISGSAVANTVSTGVITIPLMKRAGFPAPFAGGVEAASSTGGQLVPPIMGAGAFVMAATTQIPYTTIAAMSLLPAVLYFATLLFFVRIEAKRSHAIALMDDDAPTALEAFREGGLSFILPIGLLITMLIMGFTPTYAAGYSIIAAIVASWTSKSHRMGWREIIEALELGSRNMIMTAVLLCSVGLIVNVIATTGLGNSFSLQISQWSGGSLLIAIILVGLASLIIGMGLPVTAAYIVLGTLSAPALMDLILNMRLLDAIVAGTLPETAKAFFLLADPESAVKLAAPMSTEAAQIMMSKLPPETLKQVYEIAFNPALVASALLAAHLIVFWLSQDSNVTPPVCLAAFAAAAIAKSPPMQTGFRAWRVAKGLYFVPLLIAYTPLVYGNWTVMLWITFFALFGFWALSAAIEGYLERKLMHWERAMFLGLALALLWPGPFIMHVIGLVGFVLLAFWNIKTDTDPQPIESGRS